MLLFKKVSKNSLHWIQTWPFVNFFVDDSFSDSSDDFLDEYGNVRIGSGSDDDDPEDMEVDGQPKQKKGKKNKKKKKKTKEPKQSAPPIKVQPIQPAPVWDFSQPRDSILSFKEQSVLRECMIKFQAPGTANLLENKHDFDVYQQVSLQIKSTKRVI